MDPEKPDRDDVRSRQGSIRPWRRGFIVYLLAALLLATICYLFGWWTIDYLGTAYLYGALILTIFGLCMVAGNLMPLQLSKVKDVTSQTTAAQNAPIDKTESARKGLTLLVTTLIGAALLGLTGGLIKLF